MATGIEGDSFPARTEQFGNNYREPLKAKSFCKIFFEALDDFMLKVLIVAATGSLIFEYIGADPEDYGHGKYSHPSLVLRNPTQVRGEGLCLLGARPPLYRNKINYNLFLLQLGLMEQLFI